MVLSLNLDDSIDYRSIRYSFIMEFYLMLFLPLSSILCVFNVGIYGKMREKGALIRDMSEKGKKNLN